MNSYKSNLFVKQNLKSIILAVIFSTAWLLFPIGLPKLIYHCEGSDVFPVYYASPFIYKSTSMATSMAHDYYLAGFLADVFLWSIVFLFLRQIFLRWFSGSTTGSMNWVGRIFEAALLIFSLFVFWLEATTSGQTMSLVADLSETAKAWGMSCSPEFSF
jgi:hypothetical protein